MIDKKWCVGCWLTHLKFYEKIILGFDPGLAILGFGAIECEIDDQTQEQKSVSMIDFGVIKTPAKTELGKRLCIIYEDLNQLLTHIKPDLAIVEKLFFIAWQIPLPLLKQKECYYWFWLNTRFR